MAMSENAQGNSFYDSDSFVSDHEMEEEDKSRKKISSQPLPRNKKERGTKHAYTAVGKGRRPLNKPLHPVHLEVNTQRILSARNHKIVDQSNSIHLLTKQIEDLKNENKTLRTQFIRHEKALNKIETKQTDLPRILDQHEAEVLNLKELLRRSKDTLTNEIRQRKDGDNEIVKLRDNLSRANQLIGDQNLDERNMLQQQINELQEKLEAKDKNIETSNKHLENLDKTHKREIYSLKKKMKKYLVQCQDLENELELVKVNLKEKERLLDIQNIYSHRFKTLHRTTGALSLQSDQLLDKLDFRAASHRKDDKEKEPSDSDSKMMADLRTAFMDPERIKEDIRKIVEEEIMSGRIRSLEILEKSTNDCIDNTSTTSLDKLSNEGRSIVQDSYNTDQAIESEIFDKDPPTQVQSEPEIDQEALDQERKQRQLLLIKLSELDSKKKTKENNDTSKLPYSYPHDRDYLGNEESVSDIETIPANNVQHSVKTYKFSNTVDNLHNGIPSQYNNRTKEDVKQPQSTQSDGSTNTKKSQTDALHNQRNNSNSEATKDEVLSPLTVSEKKRRESELLNELFGGDFTPQPVVHGRPYPSGTRHSRSSSLLWEKEQESRKNSGSNHSNLHNNGSGSLNQSEDIEQIIL